MLSKKKGIERIARFREMYVRVRQTNAAILWNSLKVGMYESYESYPRLWNGSERLEEKGSSKKGNVDGGKVEGV